MFGFFKKKKPIKKLDENQKIDEKMIAVANNIACDFAEFIADNPPGLLIQDVSVLPHEKDTIKSACIIWMHVCDDKEHLHGWKVVLPMLAQYQEGVGPEPLGLNLSEQCFNDINLDAAKAMYEREVKLDDETREKMLAGLKRIDALQPSPALSAKVEAEHNELFELACNIVDS